MHAQPPCADFSAKEILQSSDGSVNNELEIDTANNLIEDWRLSTRYKESTMNCIPQALELGFAEFIVILVRQGLPLQLRCHTMKLFAKLLVWFPGHRQLFQERMARVLLSESENMNCCYFFSSIANIFSRGRRALKERTNLTQFTEEAEFEEQKRHLEETCIMLKFVQSLCEGHFLPLQDQFTHQPQSSINILREALRLLNKLFRCYQQVCPLSWCHARIAIGMDFKNEH